MDKDRGLVRAAGAMSIMTMLSRVAGYARDFLQASLLGAGLSSDAFVIAFRIPNMLRRLVGEGALTSAFVPTFARYMKDDDRRAMWRFATSVFYALSLLLVAIVVLGVALSPLLVKLLAWGYSADPAKFDLTVHLNRWMFPYIFLISLAALASAILNCFDRFALPAFTPLLLNLSIIGCALAFADRFEDPAYAFAVGVIAGGTLQLVVQLPPLLRRGFSLRPPRPFDLEGLKEVGRLMLPRLFGAGITQINLVVDSQFAAWLRSGSVSFLYYSIRVTELTLGVFAISLSTVILPRLSRAVVAGDREEVIGTLGTAVRLLVFVTIPATLGLWVLKAPIIHVLFERDRFTGDDTLLTSSALGWYGLGLLPMAAVSVLATGFYARRDTRTPVLVALLTFVVHLGLNFALIGPMRHDGIALSTSASALVNAALLAWILRRRTGEFLTGEVLRSAARASVAGAVMAAALLVVRGRYDILALPGIWSKVLVLAGLVAGGAGLYLGTSWALGGREVRLIGSGLRRR
ncbi:MAG: murein biosynthesis integral membrane protein MurJ [Acidobacteriota bacterium]